MAGILDALSDDAKCVAGGMFGIGVPGRTTVRFAMVESRPTARAQTAFDELVEQGVASRVTEEGGGVVYTQLVDCTPAYLWMGKNRDKAKWPVAEPIAVGSGAKGTVREYLVRMFHRDKLKGGNGWRDTAEVAEFMGWETPKALRLLDALYQADLVESVVEARGKPHLWRCQSLAPLRIRERDRHNSSPKEGHRQAWTEQQVVGPRGRVLSSWDTVDQAQRAIDKLEGRA